MTDFQVGDIVENEDENLVGEITAITEDDATITWSDGTDLYEEVVALDELSKDTLKSYIGKAGPDAVKRGVHADRTKESLKGVDKSYDASDSKQYRYKLQRKGAAMEKDIGDNEHKVGNRFKGMSLAAEKLGKEKPKGKRKLTKEEVANLEETVALDTLKAGSKTISQPESRVEALRGILGSLAKMEDNDVVAFFNKVQAGVGHEADSVSDNSAKNRSSVAMKASDAVSNIKEDVARLFEGQELSEEFIDRATTLFEAAVASRLMVFEAELQETYAEMLDEEVSAISEELNERTASYLDYVSDRWLEENAVAVESSLRSNLTENFISGLRDLFAEHYIDVPEDKVDVVEALAEKVEALENALNESINEVTELKGVISENVAEDVFEHVADGLPLTQVDKFRTLAEGVEFTGDAEKFKEKLVLIRESHFKNNSKNPTVKYEDSFNSKELLSEQVDPRVAAYVNNISKHKNI